MTDLDSEKVNLIIAVASLRIDDKPFVHSIIVTIKPDNLSTDDLLKLALSFVIYVRQFEEFYIRVHEACVVRMNRFSPE